MFKNLIVFRLTKWEETPKSLEEKLSKDVLHPCGGLDIQTRGWMPAKAEGGPFVHQCGKHLLISLGVEKKLLPGTVINQFTKVRAAEVEEREGYKPGRKQMKEIKEGVTDELLPRAFAIRSQVKAWIDTENSWLVVNSFGTAKAEDLVGLLMKSVEGFSVALVKTKTSPVVAMTSWLANNEAPENFTIDQDCELESRAEQRAKVKYSRHSLETQEISNHIQNGKDATRLALTWNNKISFVLNEHFEFKRVDPLDVIKEKAALSADDDSFDSDFALMTGEFPQLIGAVVDALGGLQHIDGPLFEQPEAEEA